MNDYESKFEKIMAGLNIDDRPSTEHRRGLRKQMLDACEETPSDMAAIRSQSGWSRMVRSRAAQGAIAAILLLGVLLTWMALADRNTEPKIALPHPEQQRETAFSSKDNEAVEEGSLQKKMIADEIKRAEEFFIAGDVKGLGLLFQTGRRETRLAAANYLSKIGTNESLNTLNALALVMYN